MTEYICKCGLKIMKSTNADTTGNRDVDECGSCPYIVNLYGDWSVETGIKIVGHECRMSKTIEFESEIRGNLNDKNSMSIYSLDFAFLSEICAWINKNIDAGLLGFAFDAKNTRAPEYTADGRYRLAISCAANKAGVVAKGLLWHEFFDEDGWRKDCPEDERSLVMRAINDATAAEASEPEETATAIGDTSENITYVDGDGIRYGVSLVPNSHGMYIIEYLDAKSSAVYKPITDWQGSEVRDAAVEVLKNRAERLGWTKAEYQLIPLSDAEEVELTEDDIKILEHIPLGWAWATDFHEICREATDYCSFADLFSAGDTLHNFFDRTNLFIDKKNTYTCKYCGDTITLHYGEGKNKCEKSIPTEVAMRWLFENGGYEFYHNKMTDSEICEMEKAKEKSCFCAGCEEDDCTCAGCLDADGRADCYGHKNCAQSECSYEERKAAGLIPATENIAEEQPAELTTTAVADPAEQGSFDYSQFSPEVAERLHDSENVIYHARRDFVVVVAAAVSAAHEMMCGTVATQCRNGDGTFSAQEKLFDKWCEHVGFSRKTAERLLNVDTLITGATPEEQAVLEQAPATLLYSASAKNAPEELVDAVKAGNITTNAEFIAQAKKIKQLEAEIAEKDNDLKRVADLNDTLTRQRDSANESYSALANAPREVEQISEEELAEMRADAEKKVRKEYDDKLREARREAADAKLAASNNISLTLDDVRQSASACTEAFDAATSAAADAIRPLVKLMPLSDALNALVTLDDYCDWLKREVDKMCSDRKAAEK